MGGLTPPNEPLPRLYSPPPKRGANPPWPKGKYDIALWGQTQRGNPSGGGFRSNPPQDGPPSLGIARDSLGSIFLVAVVPSFTDFSDFLGRLFLVNSRVSIHS